jgi:iron complex outermembrane receptor protein
LRKDLLPVEVSVLRLRTSSHKPDSNAMKWLPMRSAAELWGIQSSLALRQSVPGALTTMLYRGSTGNQNDLTWGDFVLNNPMNRTLDLQLIPGWLFPEMHILNGSDAMQAGGYGMGGQMNLRSVSEQIDLDVVVQARPDSPWLREIALTIGSSGERSLGLAMKYNQGRWYSSTRMVATVNPNRYSYRNTALQGSPKSVMNGADWDQKAMLQHLRFQYKPRSYAEVEIWAQGHRRGIPASLTSRPNSARQNDSMLRIQGSWHHSIGREYKFWLAQAFHKDLNRYTDTLQGISGLHQFELIQTRAGIEQRKRGWRIQARAQWDQQKAGSSQYSEYIRQVRWALVLPLSLQRGRSEFKVQFQKEFWQGQSLPSGLQFRWNQSGRSRWVWVEYRRAYHPPTFNDRFWVPGGNPALKPEFMHQMELGGSLNCRGRRMNLQGQLLTYGRAMRDKIWWQPQPNQSWWAPSNLSQSQSVGMEASIQISPSATKPPWALSAEYQWNRTWEGEEFAWKPQLMYVPVHKVWVQGSIHRGACFAQMMLTAVSSRETTLDGTSSLPAYALCHGGFGYEARRYRFALGLRNLANSLYQEVPWFPQPGRQVHLSFHFKF